MFDYSFSSPNPKGHHVCYFLHLATITGDNIIDGLYQLSNFNLLWTQQLKQCSLHIPLNKIYGFFFSIKIHKRNKRSKGVKQGAFCFCMCSICLSTKFCDFVLVFLIKFFMEYQIDPAWFLLLPRYKRSKWSQQQNFYFLF